MSQWTVGLGGLLEEHKAKFIFEAALSEIISEGAMVKAKDGGEYLIEADTIILSLGFRSRKDIVEEFSGLVRQTFIVGDANVPSTSMQANHGGYNAANELR